jgi:hypothetical protein
LDKFIMADSSFVQMDTPLPAFRHMTECGQALIKRLARHRPRRLHPASFDTDRAEAIFRLAAGHTPPELLCTLAVRLEPVQRMARQKPT